MFTPMNWKGTTLAFLCGVVVVAMADSREVDAFYDRLAPHYHMIFGSWEASQERQAENERTGRAPLLVYPEGATTNNR